MPIVCDYCKSPNEAGHVNCANCGAPLPVGLSATTDFKSCPYCNRKLLALGSPSCNYCGKRLPEEFIKAREGDLERVQGLPGSPEQMQGDVTVLRVFTKTTKKESSLADALINLTDIF